MAQTKAQNAQTLVLCNAVSHAYNMTLVASATRSQVVVCQEEVMMWEPIGVACNFHVAKF